MDNTINERLDNIESLLKSQKLIFNIEELSKFTGISKSTIYKLTCTNRIPHYKKAKHLYFDRKEVEAWLKSNPVKTSEDIDNQASTYVTLNQSKP